MMERMRILQRIFILVALLYHYGIHGQVTAPPSTAAELGDDVSLECTTSNTGSSVNFIWLDGDDGTGLYTGTIRTTGEPEHENVLLGASSDPQQSILNINAIEMNDDGNYSCYLAEQQIPSDAEETMVTVEVGSSSEPIVLTCNDTHYQATCDAQESKPAETITWTLDSDEQSDGIVVTDLGATLPLFSRRSTFTFLATRENFNTELMCNISGHQVTRLDRSESRLVDCHSLPQSGSIEIIIDVQESTLDVMCRRITTADEPTPAITNFYIYSNDTLIPKSTDSVNTVTVPKPEQATEFRCEAGNYLGNATATEIYDPDGTTTPPTPTAPTERPSNETNDAGKSTGPTTVNIGAIVGGVIGGIVLIVIIVLVIKFVVKPECMGGSGSGSGGSRKKTASSAVGSSNGSEKDKIKPSAAPRTQSSIQHTTDNPEQAEYAMVDRKPGGGGKGGGDMPDRGYGAGQNEPAGMVYADLDLSAKAGHTEKQIPQNQDDVVVYSSILV